MKRTPKKRKYTEEYIKKLGQKLIEWMSVENNFWLGKFASVNKMNRARLFEIARDNEEFGIIYEQAKQMQENKLVTGGLTNKFNNSMVIFALKNVAGWRDSRHLEHSGKIGNENIPKVAVIINKDSNGNRVRVDSEATRGVETSVE